MRIASTLFNRLRITKFRCIILILTSVVLFNEWLSYTMCAMNWPVPEDVKEEHVKVLIAADPQILSTDSEPGFPFNYIAVWDADRFVSRGFQLALWRTRPQVVIFLGDVLDDGSTSSDEGFRAKAEHFKNLLRIPDYVERTIYVPGDNDIGGEGMDEVTPNKVSRFFSAFKQTEVDSFKFIDFIQIRIMDAYGNETQPLPEDKNRMRILLSHMPLLPITRKTIKETIIGHHPSLIFSGHEHESFHFIGKKDVARAEEFWPLRDNDSIWKIETVTEKLHEVTVPTCSYRMGKKSYGYGSAVIGKSGLVHYNVLWLPSRFLQLGLYILSLVAVFLFTLPSLLPWLKAHVVKLCKACAVGLVSLGPKYHRV